MAERPPPSTAMRTWRNLRELHRRRVLTARRVGCGFVLLLVLTLLGMVALRHAANTVASLFTDDPVAGSPFDTAAPSAPPSSGSPALDRIVARDRLIVAAQEAPGLVERTPATGDVTGFDVALLELVARDLGVDPDRTSYKPLTGDSRAAALQRGEADVVAGGYEVPPEAPVTVAGPYLVLPQRLAVPPGSTVTGLDSLGDRQVCAVEGSAAAESLAPRLGDALVTRGSVGSCMNILNTRVVAVAADEAALAESELTAVGRPQGETRYGFGLPPGDDVLRDRVQSVLRRAVEDGTWARLYAQYLGTPVPAPPPIGR